MAEDAQNASDAAEEALSAALTGPHRVQTGQVEAQTHRLSDLVKAVEHKNRAAAARRRTGGVSFTKLVPPGAD